MSMKMTMRWFGEGNDTIPLRYFRQVPGVEGVVVTLPDVPVGEVWPREEIARLKAQVDAENLHMDVVESVNVHEDIKLGLPSRDGYIENYIETLRRLAEVGVKVVCYNFMPVFDWTRTELNHILPDGSGVMYYDQSVIDQNPDPMSMAKSMQENSGGVYLPGWEPEKIARLVDLFKQYEGFTEEDLFRHLKYFLEKIIPVCEEVGIKMAIHNDDPPWDIFGLPRIASKKANIQRILNLVDSPANGLTICSGSVGSNPENDVPDLIRSFGKRIHFAHIRNVKIEKPGLFWETSHLSTDGSFDMFELMKALYDVGFDGYVRPDHGRMIWDEEGRPGYGLYDRALGATYLNGLWESIEKMSGAL